MNVAKVTRPQRISVVRWTLDDPPEPGDVLHYESNDTWYVVDEVRPGRVHPYVLVVWRVRPEQVGPDARVVEMVREYRRRRR